MRISLRTFNNLLSLVVIGLCLYVIVAPFWPQIAYLFQKKQPLVAQIENNVSDPEKIPKEDTLVIPSMNLQQKIYEGGEETLNKGIWHMPNNGSPTNGGNTVLSGHRFTYGGPAVLYHMDKVKKGDKIVIFWKQKKYEYKVSDILVVEPTRVEIQEPTEEPMLTIYTCTPLVTASHRLVIQAKPVEENQ